MKKYEGWIMGFVLAMILVAMLLNAYHHTSSLSEGYIRIDGRIIYLGYSAGGSTSSAEYEYFVNGERYVGGFIKKRICPNLSAEEQQKLIGSEIPIIYSSSDPQISTALLDLRIVQKYDVLLTDSITALIKRNFDCE